MSSTENVTMQVITLLNGTICPDAGLNFTGNYSVYPSAENIHGLLNITRIASRKYVVPLFGYALPVFLLITIVTSTLTVMVLSKKHMRSPTNLVLSTLALSYLFTLLFPAPWYIYLYTLNNHSKLLYPTSSCYAYLIMIDVFPVFFHTANIWLTLLLAVQRYICVCHPTMARTWCTVSKMWKSMAWIYVIAMLHQSTRLFDRVFEPTRFCWQGGVHDSCVFAHAGWVRNKITENVYFTLYYVFRILFVHIVPCMALVILNALLFRALRRAEVNRQKLFEGNWKSEFQKLSDSNRITGMLIVVITIFLVVEIPHTIVLLLYVMQSLLDAFWPGRYRIANHGDLTLTVLFSNFIIILSYPANLVIYCGMSRQFRETFKDLFRKSHVAGDKKN